MNLFLFFKYLCFSCSCQMMNFTSMPSSLVIKKHVACGLLAGIVLSLGVCGGLDLDSGPASVSAPHMLG